MTAATRAAAPRRSLATAPRRALAAAGAAALLAGCAAAGPGAAPGDPAAPAPALAGTRWLAVEIGDAPPVVGTRSTLAFGENGQVVGNASCNRFSGGYRQDGARLRFDRMITTRQVCAPATMEQEARVLALLRAAAEARTDAEGRLALRAPAGRLLYVPDPVPDRPTTAAGPRPAPAALPNVGTGSPPRRGGSDTSRGPPGAAASILGTPQHGNLLTPALRAP